MSKPNKQANKRVKNSTLLPTVFQTDPNTKMLDSTLDLATSKGQLTPFNNSFGLRSASDATEDFLIKESDPARAESQTNIAFVTYDDAGNYAGKTAYVDVDNYFNIKGLPLKLRSQLDKDILDLDLPILTKPFTNYDQFYWLPLGLPPIILNYPSNTPIDIRNDIIGQPNVILVDPASGQTLTLLSGMQIIFTGTGVAPEFRTEDLDLPKVFHVKDHISGTTLLAVANYDSRIPQSVLGSVGWDPVPSVTARVNGWGGSTYIPSWDTSTNIGIDPEYIVINRYSDVQSQWSIINNWYNLSTITAVANFLAIPLATLAKPEFRAVRPIINFYGNLKLSNWPNMKKKVTYQHTDITFNGVDKRSDEEFSDYVDRKITSILLLREAGRYSNGQLVKFPQKSNDMYCITFTETVSSLRNIKSGDVHAVLLYSPSYYLQKKNIIDIHGHELAENDFVIFTGGGEEPGSANIYRVNFNSAGLPTFHEYATGIETGSVIYTSPGKAIYFRYMLKNGTWIEAQNKTRKNQAPLFKLFNLDAVDLETLTGGEFKGVKILDFAQGDLYDPVLDRNISVSSIDYGIVDKNNQQNISGAQMSFEIDIDAPLSYIDSVFGLTTISGPFMYQSDSFRTFWKNINGVDISPEIYDLTYNTNESTGEWTSAITNILPEVNEIHVFNNANGEPGLYLKLSNRGYVKFTTINSSNSFEKLIPLMAGEVNKIICHNISSPIIIYKSVLTGQVSTLIQIASSEDSSVIMLDLTDATDTTNYIWKFTDKYRTAVAQNRYKWRFLNNVYLKDYTTPIFTGYDLDFGDLYDENSVIDQANKLVYGLPNLDYKAAQGDKILVETLSNIVDKKTAPHSLTRNPLNSTVEKINYYSLYQHYISQESKVDNILFGSGTIIKHNNPMAKTAVIATQTPFDIVEVISAQGRHYDLFLDKFTAELANAVKNSNEFNSYDIIDLALTNLYANQRDELGFWNHSNMMGWGNTGHKTVQEVIADSAQSSSITPISHRAGKETILHVIDADGKIMIKDIDYFLSGQDGFYTGISFAAIHNFKKFTICQWSAGFASKIPASLAKIGLAPVHLPEIYSGEPGNNIYLIRHDGTKYLIAGGLDANGYPNDIMSALLYEYEKAVWSSIAYDVEHNSFADYYQDVPGGFRGGVYSWDEYRSVVSSKVLNWTIKGGKYFSFASYFQNSDPFTFKYKVNLGTESVVGSWRAVYKYFYDTDKPHTHPWEMMGYSIKPQWWDANYSWADPVKRIALEQALRVGLITDPALGNISNPYFARDSFGLSEISFPVAADGALLPPTLLDWLQPMLDLSIQNEDWKPGEQSDIECDFLNTHTGLSSEIGLLYLLSPSKYVTNNWIPGDVVLKNNLKLNRTTMQHITAAMDITTYHKAVFDGATQYTAGIESLLSEYSVLNNIDFYSTLVAVLNNIAAKKEILLGGFANQDNIRIKSSGIKNLTSNMFVPEENFKVRVVSHYPHLEIFYSGVRILWNGKTWSVFGFASECPFFTYYKPTLRSSISPIKIGDLVFKQKNSYDSTVEYQLRYGEQFTNRQDLYDFLIGYGKWLTKIGFIFNEPEGGDIRDFQLAAKQFVMWSSDAPSPGNYIDLNPAADQLVFSNTLGQFEDLSGTNLNPGLCVDRDARPLASKDLLVIRGDTTIISTKDKTRSIYGIKMTFVKYESVVHLDPVNAFGDVYFSVEQFITKRSFMIGGKKSTDWTGEYFVPGYLFSNGSIIPNYDSMTEAGRDLLNFESSISDSKMTDAARAQFGLNRNHELGSLFITDDLETQFKSATAFVKGTQKAFESLSPLVQSNGVITTPSEEYLIRTGEIGNTRNIEFYEFELSRTSLKKDTQAVKFELDITLDPDVVYVTPNTTVYAPYLNGKQKSLRFKTTQAPSILDMAPVDTDYSISDINGIPELYSEFEVLYGTISSYDNSRSYLPNDQFRYQGRLYSVLGTIPAYLGMEISAAFALLTGMVVEISEAYLPNMLIKNYNATNPDLSAQGTTLSTPGTWQVLQTTDTKIGIYEVCTGLTDSSLSRITTHEPHGLQAGDLVLIINAENGISSVNGIWSVTSVGDIVGSTGSGNVGPTQFFINTRITTEIRGGKIFTFKPVRFSNAADLALALAPDNEFGYSFYPKFNPQSNALGKTNIVPPLTAGGYPSQYPIAIVNESTLNGDYSVYSISDNTATLVSQHVSPVDISDIEHLVIYDHASGKTVAKLEMFDPKNMVFPASLRNEIDSISRVDPAHYNKTTDQFKSTYRSAVWYAEQVGHRWLDLSTLLLANYDMGTLEQRSDKWGKTVDNRTPDIYEWTMSPVPPAQWADLVKKNKEVQGIVASGQAYVDVYNGTEQYHWVEAQQHQGGNTYSVYYFWVKNKNTVAVQSRNARSYSTSALSKVLLNPSAAGIAWWAPVSHNTIIIRGVETYLNDHTVVQIKRNLSGGKKSQQWMLLTDRNETTVIPEWMHIRLRDSIASTHTVEKTIKIVDWKPNAKYYANAVVRYMNSFYRALHDTQSISFDFWRNSSSYDYDWFPLILDVDYTLLSDSKLISVMTDKMVPSRSLHRYSTLGNEVRPFVQSWFGNLFEARRLFIKQANVLLSGMDLINNNPLWNRVLSTDPTLSGIWSLADYKSDSYDSTKSISVSLRTRQDMYSYSAGPDEYVEVLDDNAIYSVSSDGAINVVYRKNGTIRLTEDLFNQMYKNTWDSSSWDSLSWQDDSINRFFFKITDILRYDIFIDGQEIRYSSLMISVIRYILSEQVNVDWIQKSSTIQPINLIGQPLEAKDILSRDNVSTLVNYNNTIKSYRDKTRGGVINRQNIDKIQLSMTESFTIADIQL